MSKPDLREPDNPHHKGLCACLYPRYRDFCICGPEWVWRCPDGCTQECRCRYARWVNEAFVSDQIKYMGELLDDKS